MMYRSLVNAGWKALQRDRPRPRHDPDRRVRRPRAQPARSPASHPQGLPGNCGQTKPLLFVRTLYCVDTNYHAAARVPRPRRGLSHATPPASRRFRAQNPGLFNASGVSDHPYPSNGTPVNDGGKDPNFAAFPDLGRSRPDVRPRHLASTGRTSTTRSTTPSTATSPTRPSAPQVRFAGDRRVLHQLGRVPELQELAGQVLHAVPAHRPAGDDRSVRGLRERPGDLPTGAKKATYYAYRMPLYMPHTSFSRNQNVEVWGAARPAPFATLDGCGPPAGADPARLRGRRSRRSAP